MSDPLIQSGNHWPLVYSDRREVITDPSAPRGYVGIAPWEIPVIFTSPLIAATTSSLDSRSTWYVGCRLRPKYQLGSEVLDAVGNQAVVPINRDPVLIRFPRWKSEYSLMVEVPYWFLSIGLDIWEYTGDLDSVTDDLVRSQTDAIRVDLVRIETKIDTLL